MKKQPSKVAHNSQPAFFFITGLAAQKAHFSKNRSFIGSPCLLSTISLISAKVAKFSRKFTLFQFHAWLYGLRTHNLWKSASCKKHTNFWPQSLLAFWFKCLWYTPTPVMQVCQFSSVLDSWPFSPILTGYRTFQPPNFQPLALTPDFSSMKF